MAATAIISVADTLIVVRSKLTRAVQLKVKVGGRAVQCDTDDLGRVEEEFASMA